VSQANVELVRRFTELLNDGDFVGAFDLCDREVEFDWSRRLLDPVVLRGRDQARAYLEETMEVFEQMRLEPIELIDFGDDVLNVSTAYFRGRSSGANVMARAGILWTVRSGRIVRFRFYQTKEDALTDLPASGARTPGDTSE
jgi:ketosteroid isomerase-like protein